MVNIAILKRTLIEDVGIEIYTFLNLIENSKWAGKIGLMMKDTDCGEMISLTYYPKELEAQANERYEFLVKENSK